MKYFLDTHSFLWVLFEDERLSADVREKVKDLTNEIFVSVISYWEISLKYSIGKLELKGVTPDELPDKAKEIAIQTLPIFEEESSTFYRLPKTKHKDPFDRLIIWQAINSKIELISKDKDVKKYQKFGLKTLW